MHTHIHKLDYIYVYVYMCVYNISLEADDLKSYVDHFPCNYVQNKNSWGSKYN